MLELSYHRQAAITSKPGGFEVSKNRYINTRIWQDSWVADLDATEKLLFLYLLTNPNTSIAGVYEIPLRQIAIDTNIDQEAVKRLLGRFSDAGKVFYEVGWVIVRNFIKHQAINPNIEKGIQHEIVGLPDWLRLKVTNPQEPCYIGYESLSNASESFELFNSNLIKPNSNLNPNLNIKAAEPPIGDGLKNLRETKQRLANRKDMR